MVAMFDFIRALMDEGHTDQARELLAIERERKKLAAWPFKKKVVEEEPRRDVWIEIKKLPHEVQMQVLEKATESHWGQRMEEQPSEDDLWSALKEVTGAKKKKKKKKKGG